MSEYPMADAALASRIESAIVADGRAYVESARANDIYPEATAFSVGGGAAFWYSAGNVVNGAFGLGMGREIEREEVAALIAFFKERATPPRIDVCPHAHRSLLRWLAAAGFVATDFEAVLYQPLPCAQVRPPAEGVTVGLAQTAEERAVWSDLEARGFTDDYPSAEHRVLSDAISLRDDALHFTGHLHGQPAGTGMLVLSGSVALFNGDSTLPHARRRGVQSAILGARLAVASGSECDLAVIEAAPGGTSQRNQERAGFRMAYTRVTLELPAT